MVIQKSLYFEHSKFSEGKARQFVCYCCTTEYIVVHELIHLIEAIASFSELGVVHDGKWFGNKFVYAEPRQLFTQLISEQDNGKKTRNTNNRHTNRRSSGIECASG